MIARLLLDPETSTEGNAAEVTEIKPAPVATVVVPRPDPTKVTINKTSYEAEQAELTRLRAEETDRIEQIRQAEQDAALKRGEHLEVLKKRDEDLKAEKSKAAIAIATERTRLAESESRFLTAIAGRDLATSLPTNLVDGANAQLMKLLGDEVESRVDENGTYVTTAKDGTSLKDFITTKMALPEYQHFQRADTRGGAGGGGGGASPSKSGNKTVMTESDRMRASVMPTGVPARTMGNPLGVSRN